MGTLKTFVVTRRFEVWADRTIEAINIETALATAKAMEHGDFFAAKKDVEVNDVTVIDGTGVRED